MPCIACRLKLLSIVAELVREYCRYGSIVILINSVNEGVDDGWVLGCNVADDDGSKVYNEDGKLLIWRGNSWIW